MKNRARRSGFTLPEILVTVTVVAVLAAVVVPAVTQYVSKGDTPATQQDIVAIRNAITSYVADTRKNPTTLYDLTASSAPSGVNNFKGPYLALTVTGNTSTGTFTSTGLGVVLGSAITSSGGYLTTPLAFSGTATCADLYQLDKYLDSGSNSSSTAAAAADATTGSLTWNNSLCTTLTATAPAAVLRLVAIGT